MPTKAMEGKDAVIVTLALARKSAAEEQARAFVVAANQQFANDVALVVADLALPADTTNLTFSVERGTVVAAWPDIQPVESAA